MAPSKSLSSYFDHIHLHLPRLRLPHITSPTQTLPNPNPLSPQRSLSLSFLHTPIPIPADLSLDTILSDTLCPPLTLSDFANFIRDNEGAPEVLEFVLWFRGYERRFWLLPEEVRGRAGVVDPGEEWERYVRRRAEERSGSASGSGSRDEVVVAEKQVACEGSSGVARSEASGETLKPELQPGVENTTPAPWESIDLRALEAGTPLHEEPIILASHAAHAPLDSHSHNTQPEQGHDAQTPETEAETLAIAPWILQDAEEEEDKRRMREIIAGADKELERTVQLLMRDDMPLREEVVRVVLYFLTLSSPHALSSPHIPPLLLTLRRTTHPASFHPLYNELYTHLLLSTHPNFLRQALINTRLPFRICMYVIALGLYLGGGLAIGLALVLCGIGGHVSRGWRVCSLPLVWAGVTSGLCLWNGICPLAFGTRMRQAASWEVSPALQPSGARPSSGSTPTPTSPPADGSLAADGRPALAHVPKHATKGEGEASRKDKSNSQGEPKAGRAKGPGWLTFISHDWWATHPAAREIQWAVMCAAARWGLVAVVIWGGVILGVPARVRASG